MGHLIFIAAAKDSNSVNINSIDVDTIDELRVELIEAIKEAESIYGNRWYVDFDEVDVDDLGFDEDTLDQIFNDCFEEVKNAKQPTDPGQLKKFQFLCGILNNAIDKDLFINTINDCNDEKLNGFFINASYNTIEDCEEYIETMKNIFPVLTPLIEYYYQEYNNLFSINEFININN